MDHTGGNLALKAAYPELRVIGPAADKVLQCRPVGLGQEAGSYISRGPCMDGQGLGIVPVYCYG
jgi:glyoxylase-like metal-dependent hydrolase (beta-lactamase superfamily II)